MKKLRIVAMLLVICMVVGMVLAVPRAGLAEAAATRSPITYVDNAYNAQQLTSYELINGNSTKLTTGWYVLDQDVKLGTRLELTGDVRIVFTQGHTLSALNGILLKQDARLLLYGSKESSGHLIVRGGVKRETANSTSAVCVLPKGDVVALDTVPENLSIFDRMTQLTPQTLSVLDSSLLKKFYLDIAPKTPSSIAEPSAGAPIAGHDTDPQECNEPEAVEELPDGQEIQQGLELPEGEGSEEAKRLAANLGTALETSLLGKTVSPVAATFATSLSADDREASDEQAIADDSVGLESQDEEENADQVATDDAETVTITFDANGGSGTMDPVSIRAGENYVLPACEFTAPEGMAFQMWNLGAPGSTVTVPQSTTLKAWWKTDTSGGGSSSSSSSNSSAQSSDTSSTSSSDSSSTSSGSSSSSSTSTSDTSSTSGTSETSNTSSAQNSETTNSSASSIPNTRTYSTTSSSSSATSSTTSTPSSSAASPETGDPTSPVLIVVALVAAAAAFFVAIRVRKR